MGHIIRLTLVAATVMLVGPSAAQAGQPLICHPFQTAGGQLLPWGNGAGWNTPDGHYDVRRLVGDTLALLDTQAPVLERMENMRRAAIYATQDRAVADALLTAVRVRAKGPHASRLALFDAGYLIETYKQASNHFRRELATADGYELVARAIDMGPAVPAMEFAAALMTRGDAAASHLARARSAARADSVLARNLKTIGW